MARAAAFLASLPTVRPVESRVRQQGIGLSALSPGEVAGGVVRRARESSCLVRLTHLRPSTAEGLQGSPTGCPSALMAPRSGWCPRWGRGRQEGVCWPPCPRERPADRPTSQVPARSDTRAERAGVSRAEVFPRGCRGRKAKVPSNTHGGPGDTAQRRATVPL